MATRFTDRGQIYLDAPNGDIVFVDCERGGTFSPEEDDPRNPWRYGPETVYERDTVVIHEVETSSGDAVVLPPEFATVEEWVWAYFSGERDLREVL